MSLFLILLAAGDSKRFESSTPKPFHKVNNKTLLEHSFNAFSSFIKIKKTIIVYNKKHKKHLNKIKLKNSLKIRGGNTRQESTFMALQFIKKMKCIYNICVGICTLYGGKYTSNSNCYPYFFLF